jgi:ketosteroid isomerase-like protein
MKTQPGKDIVLSAGPETLGPLASQAVPGRRIPSSGPPRSPRRRPRVFDDLTRDLAPDIVWVAAGGSTTEGKDGVISTCEETLAELENTTTEFTRFITIADEDVAAVDVIGRYTDLAGGTSTVASCDIYEFRDNLLTRITSYTVEIDTPASAPQETEDMIAHQPRPDQTTDNSCLGT